MQGSDQIWSCAIDERPTAVAAFHHNRAALHRAPLQRYTEVPSAYQEGGAFLELVKKPVRKQRDAALHGFNLTNS
jgi:hypothetical protein